MLATSLEFMGLAGETQAVSALAGLYCIMMVKVISLLVISQ